MVPPQGGAAAAPSQLEGTGTGSWVNDRRQVQPAPPQAEPARDEAFWGLLFLSNRKQQQDRLPDLLDGLTGDLDAPPAVLDGHLLGEHQLLP